MINEEQFERLEEQNEVIIKLLAAIAIKDKDLKEQTKLLSEVGFGPNYIANLLGKKSNAIRVIKTRLRKKDG